MFLEYYRPLGGSPYFVAPGLSVERIHYFTYTANQRNDQTRSRFAGSVYFGIGTWRHLQLRLGATGGYDRYSDPVTVNGIESRSTAFANPEITGIINTQDSGQLPTRGFRLNTSGGWSFRRHPYPYVRMSIDHFQPVSRDFSMIAMGQADSTMGRKVTFYDQFTTGGLTQLDAYRYQELRADTVLMGGGGILYRGANRDNAVFRPIFGTWYEAAGLDSFDTNARFKHSATLGVFAPTPIGLAGLTFSVDFKGSTRVRLSIGSFWNRP
jgi:outer membrane protein assembly factor BamA